MVCCDGGRCLDRGNCTVRMGTCQFEPYSIRLAEIAVVVAMWAQHFRLDSVVVPGPPFAEIAFRGVRSTNPIEYLCDPCATHCRRVRARRPVNSSNTIRTNNAPLGIELPDRRHHLSPHSRR